MDIASEHAVRCIRATIGAGWQERAVRADRYYAIIEIGGPGIAKIDGVDNEIPGHAVQNAIVVGVEVVALRAGEVADEEIRRRAVLEAVVPDHQLSANAVGGSTGWGNPEPETIGGNALPRKADYTVDRAGTGPVVTFDTDQRQARQVSPGRSL